MAAERLQSYTRVEQEDIRSLEALSSPEKGEEILDIGAVLLAGPNKAGKTAIGWLLTEMLQLDQDSFIRIGDEFRKRTGIEVGHMERPIEFDRRMDKLQEKLVKKANVKKPIILDGRLSGVIRSELRAGANTMSPQFFGAEANEPKKIHHHRSKKDKERPRKNVAILVRARKAVRMQRAYDEEIKRQTAKGGSPSEWPSLAEVTRKETEREQRDYNIWSWEHPILEQQEKSAFDPKLLGPDLLPVYDLVIDTSDENIEESAQKIRDWLIKNGFVKKVGEPMSKRTNSLNGRH